MKSLILLLQIFIIFLTLSANSLSADESQSVSKLPREWDVLNRMTLSQLETKLTDNQLALLGLHLPLGSAEEKVYTTFSGLSKNKNWVALQTGLKRTRRSYEGIFKKVDLKGGTITFFNNKASLYFYLDENKLFGYKLIVNDLEDHVCKDLYSTVKQILIEKNNNGKEEITNDVHEIYTECSWSNRKRKLVLTSKYFEYKKSILILSEFIK